MTILAAYSVSGARWPFRLRSSMKASQLSSVTQVGASKLSTGFTFLQAKLVQGWRDSDPRPACAQRSHEAAILFASAVTTDDRKDLPDPSLTGRTARSWATEAGVLSRAAHAGSLLTRGGRSGAKKAKPRSTLVGRGPWRGQTLARTWNEFVLTHAPPKHSRGSRQVFARLPHLTSKLCMIFSPASSAVLAHVSLGVFLFFWRWNMAICWPDTCNVEITSLLQLVSERWMAHLPHSFLLYLPNTLSSNSFF